MDGPAYRACAEEEMYYTVTITPSEHGTMAVDKATAAEGETVTIQVQNDPGYRMVPGGLDVMDGEGNLISVSGVIGGGGLVHEFTMPASDVTLSILFEVCTNHVFVGSVCMCGYVCPHEVYDKDGGMVYCRDCVRSCEHEMLWIRTVFAMSVDTVAHNCITYSMKLRRLRILVMSMLLYVAGVMWNILNYIVGRNVWKRKKHWL